MAGIKKTYDWLPEDLKSLIDYDRGKHFKLRCRGCGVSRFVGSVKELMISWEAGKPIDFCRGCKKELKLVRRYPTEEEKARFNIVLDDNYKYDSNGKVWVGKFCILCKKFNPTELHSIIQIIDRNRTHTSKCLDCTRTGRVKTKGGYIYVKSKTHPHATKAGYVMEHRLVLEKDLGRYLQPGETVHHINGVRDDNRIENLQLRSGSHGPGVSLVCQDCGSKNISHDLV